MRSSGQERAGRVVAIRSGKAVGFFRVRSEHWTDRSAVCRAGGTQPRGKRAWLRIIRPHASATCASGTISIIAWIPLNEERLLAVECRAGQDARDPPPAEQERHRADGDRLGEERDLGKNARKGYGHEVVESRAVLLHLRAQHRPLQ